jgi:sortase A
VGYVVAVSAAEDEWARRAVLEGVARTTSARMPGSVIGWLEIPRLGLTAGVAEGEDAATLRFSVGHLADTPLPWEPGNSALAGHRDRQFRALARIREGDTIRLKTTRGDLTYRVTAISVVAPDDLSVLKPTRTRTLTLVTCYPFYFLGHASQRFVVRAEAAP